MFRMHIQPVDVAALHRKESDDGLAPRRDPDLVGRPDVLPKHTLGVRQRKALLPGQIRVRHLRRCIPDRRHRAYISGDKAPYDQPAAGSTGFSPLTIAGFWHASSL